MQHEPTSESADAAMPDAVKAEPSEPPPASKEPKRYILERGSEPALGLLAALGVERSTAMEHLADRAAVRLVEAIPSMPPRRRLALLSASFPHVDVPRLRPIAVAALVHAPELPDHIVSALTSDANQPLLRELPMRVRQRVWETQTPPQLFLTETHTFLHALMQECEQRFQRSALREAAEVPPKQRRAESAALKSLAELVGAKPLYAALTALCASIYVQTGNAAMGALRCDLLMALNEADDATKPVTRWDATHTFIMCIDAALREQRLEYRAIQILLNHAVVAGLPPLTDVHPASEAGSGPAPPPVFLEHCAEAAQAAEWLAEDAAANNGGGEAVADAAAAATSPGGGASSSSTYGSGGAALAELAMLLAPPPMLQLLVESTLTRLEAVVEQQVLPGSDPQLRSLVQLLSLGHKAGALNHPEKRAAILAKWAGMNGQTLHRALPQVAELMVDDQVREASRGAVRRASAESAAPGLPSALPGMLQRGHARELVLLYILRRLEAVDEARVEQMLPLVTALGAEQLYKHTEFLGGLVSVLVADPSRRLTTRIAAAVVTHCLVPLSSAMAIAHVQLLRLMTATWQTLHALAAHGATGAVEGILASAGIDGGWAARQTKATGKVDEGDAPHVERAYQKLAKLVPGVLRPEDEKI